MQAAQRRGLVGGFPKEELGVEKSRGWGMIGGSLVPPWAMSVPQGPRSPLDMDVGGQRSLGLDPRLKQGVAGGLLLH